MMLNTEAAVSVDRGWGVWGADMAPVCGSTSSKGTQAVIMWLGRIEGHSGASWLHRESERAERGLVPRGMGAHCHAVAPPCSGGLYCTWSCHTASEVVRQSCAVAPTTLGW